MLDDILQYHGLQWRSDHDKAVFSTSIPASLPRHRNTESLHDRNRVHTGVGIYTGVSNVVSEIGAGTNTE